MNTLMIKPQSYQNNSYTLKRIVSAYMQLCTSYTAMGLTFTSDTLPAISSLMGQFAPHMGQYYAGMWEQMLVFGLQWQVLDTTVCTRHKEYVAPTFSWASRSGAVSWPNWDLNGYPDNTTHKFATVLHGSCQLAGNDTFGKVLSGYISIRGYASEIEVKHVRAEGGVGAYGGCHVAIYNIVPGHTSRPRFDSIDDYRELKVGMKVTCLNIMESTVEDRRFPHRYVCALILIPVEDDLRGRCWKRIGIANDLIAEYFEESEEMELTII